MLRIHTSYQPIIEYEFRLSSFHLGDAENGIESLFKSGQHTLLLSASILRRDKTTRHSREGGNPSSSTRLKSLWIPAFAGMTDFLSVSNLSHLKREALLSLVSKDRT